MIKKIILSLLLAAFILPSLHAEETLATDFTLDDIDGNLFKLSEHVGNGPVLIDFWATWCKPCKEAMIHLQDLHEAYAEKGLTVIAISTDSPKSQSRVKPYIKSRGYTFTVLLDPGQEVLKLFQGSNLPYQVLIDSEGKIVETHMGYTPGDEVVLEAKIKELLITPKEKTLE